MNTIAMNAIIDTHVHIWNLGKVRYSWLDGDNSILNRNYALTELEPERLQAGVTGGVLVQAANNLDDTEWMIQAAHQHPWIQGVVGWLPLEDTNLTGITLSQYYNAEPLLKGVRHLIHNEKDPRWLLQPAVVESLQLLATQGLTYDVVGINNTHLECAIELARQLPGLPLVLDHLNQPPMQDAAAWNTWANLMRQAAQLPNISVKISGLGTASGNPQGWDAETIKPSLAFVLETFGVERCCCGGDWPVSLLAGSYVRTWQQYQQALESLLDAADLNAVLAANAVKLYNLQPLAAACF